MELNIEQQQEAAMAAQILAEQKASWDNHPFTTVLKSALKQRYESRVKDAIKQLDINKELSLYLLTEAREIDKIIEYVNAGYLTDSKNKLVK